MSYCDVPAGLRLDQYANTDGTGGLVKTLDFMAEGNGIRVSSFDLGFPTVRETVAAKPTTNGDYDYTWLFGPRVVTIAGSLIPSTFGSRQAMLAELMSWLDPSIRPVLVFAIDPTEATQQITMRGSQFSAPVSDRMVTAFSASWVAPDPAFESFGAKTVEVDAGGTAEVVNEGTYRAWPTFTVYGPCAGPVLEYGDAVVALGDLDLAPGEDVVVVPRTSRAYLADRSRYVRPDYRRTRWDGFPPGRTVVSSSARATIEWRDTYI
jgi:hypothetical protein